ncbi:MAG: hypothetical protein ACREEJ_06590 [Ensifer adhaerens]
MNDDNIEQQQMIRRLWTRLRAIFSRAASPPPGLADAAPAGATTVSPRLLELAKSGNVEAQAALGVHFADDREENYAAAYY